MKPGKHLTIVIKIGTEHALLRGVDEAYCGDRDFFDRQ
jgi:hypothetical protein